MTLKTSNLTESLSVQLDCVEVLITNFCNLGTKFVLPVQSSSVSYKNTSKRLEVRSDLLRFPGSTVNVCKIYHNFFCTWILWIYWILLVVHVDGKRGHRLKIPTLIRLTIEIMLFYSDKRFRQPHFGSTFRQDFFSYI